MSWNDIELDSDEEFTRLVTEVSHAGRFAFFEVMADPPAIHAQIARDLAGRLPGLAVHQMRKQDRVPIDLLEEIMAPHPAGLILYGFEWWSEGGGR